jgi:hypothetical protein
MPLAFIFSKAAASLDNQEGTFRAFMVSTKSWYPNSMSVFWKEHKKGHGQMSEKDVGQYESGCGHYSVIYIYTHTHTHTTTVNLMKRNVRSMGVP